MEIASTMGTGSLGRELDLHTLVIELQESQHSSAEANFTSEGMVTIYLRDDGPAYTLYRTGSFQIRGARTETDLKQAESRLRTLLSNLGVEMPAYEFRHATSVFVGTLDVSVNLEALAVELGLERIEYEPEQFPAIIYRPPEFDLTILIFSTGKIIIGGTTDRGEASSALSHIEGELTTLADTHE